MDDLLIRVEFFLNIPLGFNSTLIASWAIASLVFTGEPIYRAIRYREPRPIEFWPNVLLLQFTAGFALNCVWHMVHRVIGAVQDCEGVGAPIILPWVSASVQGEQCDAIELLTYGNGGLLVLVLWVLWPLLVFHQVVWADGE